MPVMPSLTRLSLVIAASTVCCPATRLGVRCYDPVKKLCSGQFTTGTLGVEYPYTSQEECQAAVHAGEAMCAAPAFILCIHECKDGDGRVWSDQVCSQATEDPRCPVDTRPGCGYSEVSNPHPFETTRGGLTPQQQCEQFDCRYSGMPFNRGDDTACKPGKNPDPDPKVVSIQVPALGLPDEPACLRVSHTESSIDYMSWGPCGDAGLREKFTLFSPGPLCPGGQGTCNSGCVKHAIYNTTWEHEGHISGHQEAVLTPDTCDGKPLTFTFPFIEGRGQIRSGDLCLEVTRAIIDTYWQWKGWLTTCSSSKYQIFQISSSASSLGERLPSDSASGGKNESWQGVVEPTLSTRPTFLPYLGVKGFRSHRSASPQSRDEVVWVHPTTGKEVRLHYDVEHGDVPILFLDEMEEIQAVSCAKEAEIITLHLANERYLRPVFGNLQQEGVIIMGGREWGCQIEGKNKVVLRRVLSVTSAPGKLKLTTVEASYADVFKHASISFKVAAYPKNHITSQSWQRGPKLRVAHQLQATRHGEVPMVGGFWDWVTGAVRAVWHAVQDVVKVVEGVVEAAAAITKILATGDYDYANHFDLASLSWNFDASTKHAATLDKDLGDGVTCKECFFNIDSSLHFDLQIQSYAVSEVAVWMEGDAQALLDVEVATSTSTAADEFNLAHVQLKEVCTTIASVPFCLDVSMIVDTGYNITVGEAGKMAARIAAQGSLKKGVLYKASEKTVHRIDEGLLEPSAGHVGSVTGSASLNLNLFPKVIFMVDHLGGPSFGARGVLEFIGDVSSKECVAPGLFGSLNFGVQFSLGAVLHVHLGSVVDWKKNWPALLSLTHKIPITSGCFEPGQTTLRLAGQAQPLKPGVSYAGILQPRKDAPPTCAGSPPIKMACQILEPGQEGRVVHVSNTQWTFPMPSSNGPGSYNPFAVSQQSMKIEGQQFLPIFSDAEINTQDGSEEDLQLPAPTWDVKFSDHYASMTLTDTNPSSCYSGATLHRSLEDILADLTSPKGVDLTGIYV